MATPESTPVPQFFYTKNYPYRWSSGPQLHALNPETWDAIASLEEAKELAEKFQVLSDGEDACVTTYGVHYKLPFITEAMQAAQKAEQK
ncbi:hypothetical protein FZI19_20910 [Cronobacter muytjensii]|uniref:Uncharacterized protein n=1 Tax=Cronobacter muytjensii TaxID=413501 RepID=A0ABQ6TU39_9ENTR|nr:hypothetical protein [Cronobacter muytjensii]KAB0871153.1 hypothetical protein FZI19_20910 [Cronobacter muytjensii]